MSTTTLSEVKKQEISAVDALWVLIQRQTKSVRKALVKRLLEEEQTTLAQKTMVKESLTKAFDELHAGQVKHDARSLVQQIETE